MPTERFYIEREWNPTDLVSLEGTEFHHLVNVMRAKAGETIELVNGYGSLAIADIKKLEKKSAQLVIQNTTQESPSKTAIILAQAIPRMNRLDFILEKGTELGMTELWLFPGMQGERKLLTDHQLERMKSITIAAMKQCGRLYLPKLVQKSTILEWDKHEHKLFYGSVLAEAPIFEKRWNASLPLGEGVIFVVGPESGLSEQEIHKLDGLGGCGVKLHQNILRTDTASLAAMALINHWML